MKVKNQDSPNFGSRYVISELPIGDKVIGYGMMGGLREYVFSPLSDKETLQNTKINLVISNLIKRIQETLGKNHKIKINKQSPIGRFPKEHIIDVNDYLDPSIEKYISKANKKLRKKVLWLFPIKSSDDPQINVVNFVGGDPNLPK